MVAANQADQRTDDDLVNCSSHDHGAAKNNNEMQQQQIAAGETVHVPLENDVLLGRGLDAFNHEGNRRFRELCRTQAEAYGKQPNRRAKTVVAQFVLRTVEQRGGRFLARDKATWITVSYKKARDKVGHALRDASMTLKRKQMKKIQSKRSACSIETSQQTSILSLLLKTRPELLEPIAVFREVPKKTVDEQLKEDLQGFFADRHDLKRCMDDDYPSLLQQTPDLEPLPIDDGAVVPVIDSWVVSAFQEVHH